MVVPTLLLTGTTGAGKSTLAAEILDLLAAHRVPSAALDLDALVWQWPESSAWNEDLLFENLAALWPNYQAHGATHLVLARVLEEARELERYRTAVPGADITVCRLTAPESVRLERLRHRMQPGPALDWHLARTVELDRILDAVGDVGVDSFAAENGRRPVRDVAQEILVRVGWIPGVLCP